jgi:hypothetical protein
MPRVVSVEVALKRSLRVCTDVHESTHMHTHAHKNIYMHIFANARFVAELDPAVRGRTPTGIAKMRELCEAALTTAGLHAAEAGKLWAQYRSVSLFGCTYVLCLRTSVCLCGVVLTACCRAGAV